MSVSQKWAEGNAKLKDEDSRRVEWLNATKPRFLLKADHKSELLTSQNRDQLRDCASVC